MSLGDRNHFVCGPHPPPAPRNHCPGLSAHHAGSGRHPHTPQDGHRHPGRKGQEWARTEDLDPVCCCGECLLWEPRGTSVAGLPRGPLTRLGARWGLSRAVRASGVHYCVAGYFPDSPRVPTVQEGGVSESPEVGAPVALDEWLNETRAVPPAERYLALNRDSCVPCDTA